ncbi:Nif3-like dinuclear metal center hexameric protein [Spiroplasma endosymbiont of Nebria brevicollis]|uniref:Nif3-like dinuclear metal center hexameric protein n=1 Tax=Spiroplasma endosymbiont of Nebria brevicollis TaxID=3066284 RepID=UPI00313EE4B4
MLPIKTIITVIEDKFPLANACLWDFIGWQIKAKININKILVCLDITNAVLEQALTDGIELIICHHPLVFASDINHPSISPWKKKLYQKIKNNDINVYTLHTNFDRDEKGMNVLMAQSLNLENINFLGQDKLAIVGNLNQALSVSTIIKNVKTYFNIEYLQLIGNQQQIINNVALSAGAGGDAITILPNSIQLFITGEMKWHHIIEAQDYGINVLLVGHYMEQKFVDFIHDFLYQAFNGQLEVIKYKHQQPVIII